MLPLAATLSAVVGVGSGGGGGGGAAAPLFAAGDAVKRAENKRADQRERERERERE